MRVFVTLLCPFGARLSVAGVAAFRSEGDAARDALRRVNADIQTVGHLGEIEAILAARRYTFMWRTAELPNSAATCYVVAKSSLTIMIARATLDELSDKIAPEAHLAAEALAPGGIFCEEGRLYDYETHLLWVRAIVPPAVGALTKPARGGKKADR